MNCRDLYEWTVIDLYEWTVIDLYEWTVDLDEL